MSYIIRTHQLTKAFDNKVVVNNVNINVKQSEIYGFLGPNDASKITILIMIMNLIKPESGKIEIFGERLTGSSYKLIGVKK